MIKRFRVTKLERAFLYKHGAYVRTLRPGAHWALGFGHDVKRTSVAEMALRAEDLEVLAKDETLWAELAIVELRDHERALVTIDGRLRCVLLPGRTAFWKVLRDVQVEVQDARRLRFEHPSLSLEAILAAPGGHEALEEIQVPPGSRGLVFVDERLADELAPGRYAFWKGVARLRAIVLDEREQVLEVTGQEVLTKDKATVRLNVALSYRIAAPRRWLEAATDSRGTLYRELQLAVRTAVSARTLDELVLAKDAVSVEVQTAIARRAETLGAHALSVGLKDLILPGELRALVNQVLEAEKRAQANLIARREETAATRALLNTAKLYAENPTLLRLKELEVAERIAEKVKELRVSGLDEVLTRLLPGPRTS